MSLENTKMDNGIIANGSSLVLVKYDRDDNVSATFDLGLNYKDFSLFNTSFTVNNGTALFANQSWDLKTGDYAEAYNSFRSLADTNDIRWGVLAVDSIASGAGSSGIIQTFNTTNSPIPNKLSNFALATQLGVVNNHINGGNFAADKVVSNQVANVSQAVGDGNMLNLMVGDTINGTGGLATASYNQSMNIVERLGGGSSFTNSNVAFYGTDANRASFSLTDNGVLTFTSAATVTNKLKIAALYAAVFDRAPDQEGLNFWATEAKTSTTVFNTIANGFVQHPVFTEVYASLSNSAFVNKLYVNILGAAGDASGVTYWTGLLNNNISRADVLSSFVQASLEIDLSVGAAALNITEAELATAQIRQNFITNKSTVGVAFADLLGIDSNLKATTNPNTLAGLRADPAYLVSEAVLKSVTDNKASADAKITVIQNAADSYNAPNSANALLFIANVFATEAAEAASRTIVMTSVANPTGAAGKIYSLDGVNKPELQFVRGAVYVFDQSDASNVTHQMAFKDASGLSYTIGVVTTGIAGQAGAKTTLTVASDAPEGLRYYCIAHGNNMGNIIANSGGAASYFVVEAVVSNYAVGAATYYNTSANDTDSTFMLFDQSFDEALEFTGVTLVGTVEILG